MTTPPPLEQAPCPVCTDAALLEREIKVDEIVRSMIRHEDSLLNHRITWLCQIQGLLFAASGVVWDKPGNPCLIVVFAVFGIFVALSGGVGCKMAVAAADELSKLRRVPKDQRAFRPDTLGLRADEHPEFRPLWMPWTFLPKLFIGAWLFVLFVHIMRLMHPSGTGINV